MSDPTDLPSAPYDLLSATYDLSAGRRPVDRSYIICSTPRSGSTLLAEAMHRTGQLGIPVEYLDIGATLPYLYQRWQCDGFEDYVQRLHDHRSTDNGVFGVKTHWHQLIQFANSSQGVDTLADVGLNVLVGVLRRVTPNPHFIYVTRNDKARQAVSHWVAGQTQRWIALEDQQVGELPPYDFDEIDSIRKLTDASESDWNRFFSLAGVEPLRVVYEDFVVAYEETVRRAAVHVGIDPESLTLPPPRMRKQSNDISKSYAERYREATAD